MSETELQIISILREILGSEILEQDLTPSTELLGEARLVSSVALVELCIRLEDRAIELGFEFDWISDSAMSRGRSIFRSIESLAEEFDQQMKTAQ